MSRILRAEPGLSQQELSARLGMQPSRRNVIVLTARGRRALEAIGRVAAEHENDICAGLTVRERDQLRGLLARVAVEQGLMPGVHPGYRTLAAAAGARAAE